MVKKTRFETNSATADPKIVRAFILFLSLSFFTIFLIFPLVTIFSEALRKGWNYYLSALGQEDTLNAIGLTFIVAIVTLPLNLIFGIAAAWLIARFHFRGKQLLISLIDLPFSVPPVITGLIYVLVYGVQGWMGEWLIENNFRVIFAVPGIILATLFVTFPFVARELIPLMQAQGSEEEEASIVLGATGWQTFTKVTLPNIKWV